MGLASCFRCCRAPHVATQVLLGRVAVAGGVRQHDGAVLQSIVQTLLATTERADSDTRAGWRHACLHALNALVRHTDSLPLVFQLAPPMLGKLQESFANPAPTAGGGPAGGNPPRSLPWPGGE
jgi:hypothetical protein